MGAHFDVVVVGAGPGGYVAAVRAAQLGLSVGVVEQKYWGGVCLNVGCIPSKALLRNAELAHLVTSEAETFGMTVEGGRVGFDYGVAFDRSRRVSAERNKGVHYLMKKNGITEYQGHATFTDPHTLRVDGGLGAETVTFGHCVLATGATAKPLPGVRFSERVVAYEEQILTRELPSEIVIVGAGAIGVEFAYVLRAYGVKVSLVEFRDRMVPGEDVEVSRELARAYAKLGITVRTSTRVEAVDDSADRVRVAVRRQDRREVLEADRVLLATGFQPRTEGYGLEATGVRLTAGGAIEVDGRCRTSEPHLFAVGDVTGQLMLAHVAEAMGMVAAETIAGVETSRLDYAMMPRATYCKPQIASFGHTEEQAHALGLDIRVAKFPFSVNGKACGLGETSGFAKVLCDAGSGELLGAHLVGPEVTELLPELTAAQRWEATASELARNVHAHPTLGEAVKEAVHDLAGHMVNM